LLPSSIAGTIFFTARHQKLISSSSMHFFVPVILRTATALRRGGLSLREQHWLTLSDCRRRRPHSDEVNHVANLTNRRGLAAQSEE